jgi:hypothetical protein
LRTLLLALAAALITGCATPDVLPTPESRLTNAETEMAECKERFGLAGVPTPESTMLYDPGTSPAVLTSEATRQVRVKTMCSGQLEELLNARRELKRAP